MKRKKIIILSIAIIGLLLIVTGVTYAFVNINFEGTKINSLYVPSISLTYSESGNALTIDTRVNNDNEGKSLPYFEFSVSGTSEVDYPLDYYIYLTEEESSLTKDQIKFYLTKVENNSETQVLEPTLGSNLKNYGTNENDLFLYKASFDFTEENNTFSDTYRLRGWISHDVKIEVDPDINFSDGTQDITINSLSYKFKVNVSTTSMDSYCYGFDKSTGTITNYYCYPGNSYGYENISDLEIPSNIDGVRVTTIGSAFINKSLTSVTIPETVTNITVGAFRNNRINSLVIPSSVTSIGSYAFNNNQLPDEDAFIYARKSDGSEDKTKIVSYAGAKRENVIIPEGVLRIAISAFVSCQINSITLPEGLERIDDGAFEANNLTELNIPNTVTYIGNGAINNNYFPEETAYLFARNSDGTIDDTTLVSYGGNQEVVNIPNTIKTIKTYAINDGTRNSIKTIVVPESVETIENYAFSKSRYNNTSLTTIVNQTGKSFNWGLIINNVSGYNFVTGTVINSLGNIEVVSQ